MYNKKYYLSASVVAKTAEALVNYKNTTPLSLTPMKDVYEMYARTVFTDNEFDFQRFFRVARCLGWNVKRKGQEYYENGVKIR